MDRLNPFSLVDQLLRRQVPLVIIGGHAVNFHGYLRATEDIDLIFRRDVDTEQVLYETLLEAGAFWIGNEIDPKSGLERTHPVTLQYVRENHLLLLGSSVGYIDVFDFIPGLPNEPLDDLLASAVLSSGRPFASLDWLKRMKRAADRPRDRIDLEHLP